MYAAGSFFVQIHVKFMLVVLHTCVLSLMHDVVYWGGRFPINVLKLDHTMSSLLPWCARITLPKREIAYGMRV